jgi:sugar/nucleoside kinase (ribokinase family)
MLDERAFSAADICIVGNINRDIKISPIPAGEYLFADGETSLASVAETVGGGGANSALAAAGLGACVAFLGQVGADPLGDRLERALTSQGVAASLKRQPACPTGTSVNLTFTNGQRHFLSCLPNNISLACEDLDLGALAGYHHLLRADIWFSDAMLYGGNQRLFQHARAAGLRISMDLNWDPRWGVASAAEVRRRKEAVRGVLPLVDLVHGNTRELNEFTDSSDWRRSLQVLEAWGAGAVVVHLGAEGAGYYQQGLLTLEPAAPARRQVNTTGTGDVLSVCMMLLDRDRGSSIVEKLRLANRVVAEFMAGERALIPPLGG